VNRKRYTYSSPLAYSVSGPGAGKVADSEGPALRIITVAPRWRVVACAALLTLCAAFTAYYRVFVGLTSYDDEGYMIWTVKNFFSGQALYDQVATVYGPFYYFYEWCVLSVTGLPAASDSLRPVSAAFWVAAALMAFVLVYRATGSLALAMCAHLLAFRALEFIGTEPAHPQEACIFLLLALGRAFYIANRTLRMVLMGVLAGVIAASKINLGIFVLVALTVGLTYAHPPGWRRRAACVAVSLGALALPAVLMWDRFAEPWALSYCALVVLSLASVLVTVWRMPWTRGRGLHDLGLVAGVFAATATAICCFALAHGSTLRNLFVWLFVMSRRWSQSWSLPVHLRSAALGWAVLGLMFAWYAGRHRFADRWLAVLKLAFGAAVLLMCATDRYQGLLNFATPCLWLLAARPANAGAGPGDNRVRSLLALFGVIQVLYAYPVAGSQVAFVAVFMIVIAGICFWDGLSWIMRRRFEGPSNRIPKWVSTTAQVSAALLIAGLNLAFAWDARRTYDSLRSLNLPGSTRVRVEPEKAAALRAIVSRVNSSCGTLVTEPGLFSFHLWTGKPSPPGVDHQVWVPSLDDAAQNTIVRELARDPRSCVVYRQDVADLWTKGTDVSAKPVIRFIRENFEVVFAGSGYSLLMRRRVAG
jgi:hypothetical protein